MNLKSELYGTGALGPPQLFGTRDGKVHQQLRKALGGTQVAYTAPILTVRNALRFPGADFKHRSGRSVS
jgi:hypothetical protein